MSSSNYHRLVAFLVNICTYVLMELLIHCAKNEPGHTYTDLTNYMLDPKIKKAVNSLQGIRKDQLRKLYPRRDVFDESALDASLLVTLLIELHKNTIVQGNVRKTLNEIRKNRNTLQHKHRTTDVDDDEFKTMWTSLNMSSMTLAKTARGPTFEKEIKEKIDDLMVNFLPGLPDILSDWFMDIVSDLRSQIEEIKTTSTYIKEDTVAIKQNTDVIPGMMHMIRVIAGDLGSVSRHLFGAGKQCISLGYGLVKLSLIKSIEILQREGDTELPWYTSIVWLPNDPNGRMAALDFANQKPVIMNKDFQLIGQPYVLIENACGLCAISNDKLIVSNNNSFYVLKVCKSSNLKLVKTFKNTYGECILSAMSPDTFTVCNTYADPPVAMVTLYDNTIKLTDIPNLQYKGKSHVINIEWVTYVEETDSIILTDFENDTIYMYSRRNQMTVTVKDERLKGLSGVCAGPGGSVFVCNPVTHSIVHISPTGDIIDCHKLDMVCLYAAAFDSKQSILVVTSDSTQSPLTRLYYVDYA